MLESIDFYYDGICSTDMQILNVSVDSGLYTETFVAERQINEIQVRGNDKPYFQGVKRSPLSFKLTFAFDGYYDENKIRAVARWLDQEYYKPFYTTEQPDRVFYCMLNSSSELLHNGLKQGYITLEMRCDSPYSYSPIYMSTTYEWDESPKVIAEKSADSSFSLGTLDHVEVGETGELKLETARTRWSDFTATMTWNDL